MSSIVSAPDPAGQPPLALSVLAAVIASRSVQLSPPVVPALLSTLIGAGTNS